MKNIFCSNRGLFVSSNSVIWRLPRRFANHSTIAVSQLVSHYSTLVGLWRQFAETWPTRPSYKVALGILRRDVCPATKTFKSALNFRLVFPISQESKSRSKIAKKKPFILHQQTLLSQMSSEIGVTGFRWLSKVDLTYTRASTVLFSTNFKVERRHLGSSESRHCLAYFEGN